MGWYWIKVTFYTCNTCNFAVRPVSIATGLWWRQLNQRKQPFINMTRAFYFFDPDIESTCPWCHARHAAITSSNWEIVCADICTKSGKGIFDTRLQSKFMHGKTVNSSYIETFVFSTVKHFTWSRRVNSITVTTSFRLLRKCKYNSVLWHLGTSKRTLVIDVCVIFRTS